MQNDKIQEMAQLAGVGGMALDEVVRARAQALDVTLSGLVAIRSALFTMEANAAAQFRDLQSAIATFQSAAAKLQEKNNE